MGRDREDQVSRKDVGSRESAGAPGGDPSAKARSTLWPVVLLLALGLVVGIWLGNDFGMSWDEYRNADVGADALRLPSGSWDYFSNPSLADHGPVYFMVFSAGSQVISRLFPGWTEADGRHLINFLTFLAAVLTFYLLSRRLLRRPYDWMATVLFATQPLFFGYAFVNQKDIPFLAAFMATVVAGLAALDRWRASERPPEHAENGARGFRSSLKAQWLGLSTSRKLLLGILGLAVVGLSLDLLFFGTSHRFGKSLVEAAYNGAALAPLQGLFDSFAVDAYKTPIEAYFGKYEALFTNLSIATIALLGFGTLCLFSLALPSLGGRWGFSRVLAGSPAWVGSAVLLGFTICMRQVGAFVGLLVSLAALHQGRSRAFFSLVVYWMIAGVATLATWPYLWPDPLQRFIDSMQLAAVFSPHSTLFRGQRFASGNLPWDFFPTLTLLQLTETAVLLAAIGLFVAFLGMIRREQRTFLIEILVLWVGVPLALLIAFKTAGYEFRQFLFMLPPVLLLAGIGLEAIGTRFRRSWATGALFVLAVLPGVLGIIQLHPYEYIYFNSFAGGVSGADGQYQLERECLSYREAIEVVNRIARPGAVVVVPQQTNQVEPFARPDLVLRDISGGLDDADFVLSCTWRDKDDFSTKGFSRAYVVRRGTAVLTEVLERAEHP